MPEQWMYDVMGDEARPRPGFEDQLARELHHEWRNRRTLWRAIAWGAAAAALLIGVVAVVAKDDTKQIAPADTTVPVSALPSTTAATETTMDAATATTATPTTTAPSTTVEPPTTGVGLYLFALATVVVPPLVPLLQGVYPPERVFTPLLLPLCVVMAALAERWPKTTALFCLAVFFNVRLMFLNETYAKRVETLYHNEMAADIGLRVYIHDHPTLRVLLLYHNRLNGEPVQIDYSRTFSAFDTSVFSGKYDRVFSRLPVEGFSKNEFWYEK